MRKGIIFGGKSYEHEISIVSAITVLEKLPELEICIFLDQDHQFYLIEKSAMKAKHFSSGAYKKRPKLRLGLKGFETQKCFSKKIEDVTYINMVHGGDGEDGTLASMFDFYQIPFIGPRKEASVLSCDKFITKMYAKALGINVVDYQLVNRHDYQSFKCHFDLPVIIKPVTLGSSIGVSIVKEQSEMNYALETAFEFDDKVIVEPFIDGVLEYNLAGTFIQDEWKLSLLEEPEKSSFLDFDKKYLDFSRTGGANEAEILDTISSEIEDAFKTIYKNYFKGSLIRCDFFVIEGKVYLNEINPIPGSMANYLFDDFQSITKALFEDIPHPRSIQVQYQYINKIHASKGK